MKLLQSFKLENLFPFLRWFPLNRENMRLDLIAGITVALILVPQSMAYAQLAGLPVVYGLYASLLPVVVATMWGSSNQLHTGPVAMLALISAVTIIPFASPGSEKFIELSIMLALMVGVLRLLLGLLRLGAMVNLLSSPVIVGFTNAAALIIGMSLLAEVLNVPFPRSEVFMADLWGVIAQIKQAHLPTLGFALATIVIILSMRRYIPRFPGILVAVVVTTLFSWGTGFEKNHSVPLSSVINDKERAEIIKLAETEQHIQSLLTQLGEINQRLRSVKTGTEKLIEIESLMKAQADTDRRTIDLLKSENNKRRVELYAIKFVRAMQVNGEYEYHAVKQPTEAYWHVTKVSGDQVKFVGGGRVVGRIPEGLPSFNVPTVHWNMLLALLPGALVMAMIGFLEAMSISKAISAMTHERINPSRELVGQGLANIVGSFFQSFVVSGSFSRSAVAARMGARTGIFALVSALAVAMVLLFFTPYLYHLPLAVLAVIVMMAVFDLIKIRPLVSAWKVDRLSAIIGILTFAATLAMAPSIANGVLIGIGLSILLLLIRQMKPRAVMLGLLPDGNMSCIKSNEIEPISKHFVTVRLDGSLDFLNTAHFEDVILEAIAMFPEAKAVLVIGGGINSIDASGEEKVREVALMLKKQNIVLAFSSLKQQVREKFERAGLHKLLEEKNVFYSREIAIRTLLERYHITDAAVPG